MFGVMGSVSMLAGVLINTIGWVGLNQVALVPLVILAAALLRQRHRP